MSALFPLKPGYDTIGYSRRAMCHSITPNMIKHMSTRQFHTARPLPIVARARSCARA